MVNLHENLVPRCTIRRSLVCWMPIIRAKSSIGFHRPKSFVESWLVPRDLRLFLLLLLLLRRSWVGIATGTCGTTGCGVLGGAASIGVAGCGVIGAGVVVVETIGSDWTKVCCGPTAAVACWDCDWVRERPTRFIWEGWIPKLYSTISSSKRLRFIERDELQEN